MDSPEELEFVPPMLLRRVPTLPEGPEWGYEVKWDGYRMQALKCGGAAKLVSRNGADYTRRFPEVAACVARLKAKSAHLDGELVALDRQGRPSFQVLQGGLPFPDGWSPGFYAFDLVSMGGRNMRFEPLKERRKWLPEVLDGSGLRYSGALEGSAERVVAAVRAHKLEGVVAKRLDSAYEPGKRTGAWVKLPLKEEGQFLVGGYRPRGDGLGVLLVGSFEGERFVFCGKVRVFLQGALRQLLFQAVKKLEVRKCGFVNVPNCKKDPFDEMITAEEMRELRWVEPVIQVPVEYREWTRFGVLRHAELKLEVRR